MIGTLLGAAFHFGLALFAGWLALGISDPVFSRWSSTWRTGSAWLKHLAHALFN